MVVLSTKGSVFRRPYSYRNGRLFSVVYTTKWTLFICSFLFIICFSCGDDNIVYKEKLNVNPQGMTWYDSLVFTMNIPDTADRYQLFLVVDHSPDFSYENVYLNLHTHYPDREGSSGLVSVQLQGEDGRWSGDCSSSSCKLEVSLKDRVRFERTGDYNVVVRQASRESLLFGIKSIGLSLEKNQFL